MTDGDRQRVALITGGAVRVGRAISLGLARAGYDLVITYCSSSAQAKTLSADVSALGRTLVHVEADLSEAHSADRVIDTVRTSFGRLDVLINSAASFQDVPLLDVDAEEWDRVMDLNVRAPHLIVRAGADMLRDSRGCVVNITDLSAWQAWSVYPHHAVSKSALAHLTRIQARALAPQVRVNGIAPGAVLPPDDWPMERRQALAERSALDRNGTPDDVVQALMYLIEADFVTGHIIPVDGGRLLGPSGPQA